MLQGDRRADRNGGAAQALLKWLAGIAAAFILGFSSWAFRTSERIAAMEKDDSWQNIVLNQIDDRLERLAERVDSLAKVSDDSSSMSVEQKPTPLLESTEMSPIPTIEGQGG